MTVEIVVHCFGKFYATLLAQQLRSLAEWKHGTVCITVLYLQEESHILGHATRGIHWTHARYLTYNKPELLNRNIGRNLAAKATKADWVWFCDADYLFGPGSLEAVAALDPHAACMYWPQSVLRPEAGDFFDDWPEGMDAVGRCTVPSRVRKAIGGCQIVPGHLARQWGYLDGVERYQRPATGDVFEDTRGDGAYRGWLAAQTGLPLLPADIPNVCRLRHRIPVCNARHHLLPMEE